MTFWERYYELCSHNGTSPNAVASELGFSNATCTKWKNGSVPGSKSAAKIADYFDVSIEYLLGAESKTSATVTDDDLKFALFDGTDGITDEMYQEVKWYAMAVKEREATKRKVAAQIDRTEYLSKSAARDGTPLSSTMTQEEIDEIEAFPKSPLTNNSQK